MLEKIKKKVKKFFQVPNCNGHLKILWHFYNAYRLYKMGFSLSHLTYDFGGFIRLNYEDDEAQDYALVDLDYARGIFVHLHTGHVKDDDRNYSIFRKNF
jgi:hypothetical protein